MKTLFLFIALLIAIQFIPADKTNPPVDDGINLNASNEVMEILKKSCYDCHSNETKWPGYSNIAPISWGVISNVNDGREALNFSKWKDIKPEIKTKRLKRAIKTVNNSMMPPPNYLRLHDEAVMSDWEKKIITDWFKSQL